MKETPVPTVVSDVELARAFCNEYFELDATPDQKGICRLIDGEVVGAVLYDRYNGSHIWAHCCGKKGVNWLNRQMLHTMFDYPFNQLGVNRISLWIEATNIDSRVFAQHLGFSHETTLEGAGRNQVDVCIYRMFKKECRYA